MIVFMFQGSEAEKSCHKVYYVAPAEIDSRTRQGQDNKKEKKYFFFNFHNVLIKKKTLCQYHV